MAGYFPDCFVLGRAGARWTRYLRPTRSGPPLLRADRTCRAARTGSRPLADEESLLLIHPDDLRRANFRFVRIKPDVAKGASPAQEVPALIRFDLDLREPFTTGLGKCPFPVQSVFLCNKVLNMIMDQTDLNQKNAPVYSGNFRQLRFRTTATYRSSDIFVALISTGMRVPFFRCNNRSKRKGWS